jgi:glyoxylase-like metal-dependent hydrolase (beta-lactamase superfamily II)
VLASDGEALVVDAPRHTAAYVEVIDDLGAQLVAVVDTHAHADYISGGPALARAHEVPYCLHPADAVYPFDGKPGPVPYEALEDGQVLRVGRAELTVVHAPGHTEGHCCFRLGDAFALTGDFLFVHSVGRPDLGGKAEAWTRVLWRSLERARAEWPPGLAVYPAHYAGSAERNKDFTVGAPFGTLPARNAPLALDSEEAFAAWVLARVGAFPESYRRIKAINIGLETADGALSAELEAGKNQCAVSHAKR